MTLIKIQEAINAFWLWKINSNPEKLTWWLLHQMYKINTEKWVFALKILNPEIMKRKEALNNFIFSEEFSNLAKEKWVPLVSSIKNNDEYLTKVWDNYFMLFPFVEWTALLPSPALSGKSFKIGNILSKIHNIDKKYNWDPIYNELIIKENYINILEKNFNWISEKINFLKSKYNESYKLLNINNIVSHRDMDQKNVLWNQDNPIIIDWEASGWINRFVELFSTAFYWAWISSGVLDEDSFLWFLKWYKKDNEIKLDNLEIYFYWIFEWFVSWLVYNMDILNDLENTDLKQNLEINKSIKIIELLYDNMDKYLTKAKDVFI